MQNKVVVVTGAGRGLGKVISDLLVSCGATVIVSDKDEESLKLTAQEIAAEAVVSDVTKQEDIKNLAQQVISKFGKIDIWINNAGIWLPRAPVEDLDMAKAHNLIEVNLFGTMYGSVAALIQMKKQGYGTIVNVISTSALQGRPLSAAYSASKHAAKGFTDSLRGEAKEHGIRVIAIYPGGMKTALFDEQRPSDFNEYMPAETVAKKIIENLEKVEPEAEMILKRPGQQ